MKKLSATCLALALTLGTVPAHTSQQPQKPQPVPAPDEVVRITTELVQADVVVTDKNENIIGDLKLSDFDVYENGRKQDLKFMEFVSVVEGTRVEGERPAGQRSVIPPGAEVGGGLTARQLKRVIAFVVDDLTIPFDDMAAVRKVLLDFVNDQMREGDLVAIVRSVGGKGLLQQFTSEKPLLRRAIAALNVSTNPFSAFNNPAPDRIASAPQSRLGATADGVGQVGGEDATSFEDLGAQNLSDPDDESHRLIRGLISLSTANFVIDSLKEIPGRKSLVLISGGIPIFEPSSSGSAFSNVTYLMNQLANNAIRAGVVINTLDPRGLKASPGVTSFNATPGRSALGAPDPNFGRGGSSAGRADITLNTEAGGDDPFGPLLAGASEHLGLNTVANATGGVSVVNTNDFKSGLDRVLARSNGYYLLAYTPSEKFNNKFRRVEIKVKRDNAKVYSHRGYFAREEKGSPAPRTKEETILAAAKSPLAKSSLDVAANIVLKPSPASNKTMVETHILIDAKKLTFKQTPDGKYQTSFDVVGFIYDQLGRLRGGFSETVTTSLTPANYNVARSSGLTYSASAELP
ncbi:MAG: VWA domain-containing protein, partial [Pyrinomonadaceae bacterium]